MEQWLRPPYAHMARAQEQDATLLINAKGELGCGHSLYDIIRNRDCNGEFVDHGSIVTPSFSCGKMVGTTSGCI